MPIGKLYVGKVRGPGGFGEFVIPVKWLRRLVRRGRLRDATEAEIQAYGQLQTSRPVKLDLLSPAPPAELDPGPAPAPETEAEEQLELEQPTSELKPAAKRRRKD